MEESEKDEEGPVVTPEGHFVFHFWFLECGVGEFEGYECGEGKVDQAI